MTTLDNKINKILGIVKQEIISRRFRLASAESCTGGWVAKLVTDLPGSSEWFEGGVVSYSNAAKHSLLGVPVSTIEASGAVSEATVLAMTKGLLERTEADIAVSISGIAGPGGGSEEKPVGTVWIGCGLRGKAPVAQVYHFEGDRNAVREQSVKAAFEGVLTLLTDE